MEASCIPTLDIPSTTRKIVITSSRIEGNQMSIYTQYAEGVREARVEWDQVLDDATHASKRLAAVSTDFATGVIAQWDTFVEAARTCADDAQQILREQADANYAVYARALDRSTFAFAPAATDAAA